MEEQKIKWNRNEDPTIVEDKDGRIMKNLKKIYSEITMNLGFCFEQLKEGKLSEGMKETHLSLTESYVIKFLKELGYNSILEKKSKARHKEIRDTNEQNRQLKKQLGEKVSNEDVRERIKNIYTNIWHWWNIYGFGHISDFNMNSAGYTELKLSGMITDGYCAKPSKSKETKIKELTKLGFEIEDKEDVVISDKNIGILKKLITSKYPSAKVSKITIDFRGGKQKYRDIMVHITNLDDIQ